jgi:uncharacterized protein (DUF58 family)
VAAIFGRRKIAWSRLTTILFFSLKSRYLSLMAIDLLSPEQLAIPGKLEFLAKQVVEGFITGLHKSPYHGFSVEFSEHRLYNTGESTKNIDWKLYARSEKVFVKRYEEETNLRCQLVIDASASMYFPLDGASKLQFSILASAAIMNLLYRQRDAVGLAVFDDQLETLIKPRGSGAHQKLLMHELEQLLQRERKQNRTRAVEALHTIAEAVHRRSLVVIFSDMFDADTNNETLFEALQHLRYNKHEVILFHVTEENHELDFDYENRPHVFIDMETGEQLKLNPVEIQAAYRTSSAAFRKELQLKCGQYGIDLVEADTRQGFKQVLLPYLLKRSKLL